MCCQVRVRPDGAAVVDVLGCLSNSARVHLYGLPWPLVVPPNGDHQDPEGAIIRLASTSRVRCTKALDKHPYNMVVT